MRGEETNAMGKPAVSSDKWISGIKPHRSLEKGARRVLRDRLETVTRLLPIAARGKREPIRAVHQLRVSVRRATAALDVFADLLPTQRTQKLRKLLKRVRRAAGTARDLDVLAQRWLAQAGAMPDNAWEALLADVAQHRRSAQKPLRSVRKQMKRQHLEDSIREVIRRTRWRGESLEPAFAQAARERLAPRVQQLFDAEPNDRDDLTGWHEMRIAGKQLRYAMEIFADAFDPQFRDEVYPEVETLQEKLGAINDHVTAQPMLARWRHEHAPEEVHRRLDHLVEIERQGLTQAQADFHHWWTAERRATLKRRLEAYTLPNND
jgi:CHAD domain-containing protein